MLKAKKSKSTKQMSQAVKEVMKEDVTQFHCWIPCRLHWKLRDHVIKLSKKRGGRYTMVEWLIEQLESLPSFESK